MGIKSQRGTRKTKWKNLQSMLKFKVNFVHSLSQKNQKLSPHIVSHVKIIKHKSVVIVLQTFDIICFTNLPLTFIDHVENKILSIERIRTEIQNAATCLPFLNRLELQHLFVLYESDTHGAHIVMMARVTMCVAMLGRGGIGIAIEIQRTRFNNSMMISLRAEMRSKSKSVESAGESKAKRRRKIHTHSQHKNLHRSRKMKKESLGKEVDLLS